LISPNSLATSLIELMTRRFFASTLMSDHFFFISATVRGCEATAFTTSAIFCHSSAHTVPSKQHFSPLFHLANDNFYFTLSEVKFFFKFLTVFNMISQLMNINLWAFHGLFMGNYGRDMKLQKLRYI